MVGENVCFSVFMKERVYLNYLLLTKLPMFGQIFTNVTVVFKKEMFQSLDFLKCYFEFLD